MIRAVKTAAVLYSVFLTFLCLPGHAQEGTMGEGWSGNSVNAVIFRKNSLVTFRNFQYAAWYNTDRRIVLARRKLGAVKWEVRQTDFQGDATDAHKSISLMVDGAGFLHMAWGLHSDPLNYCRSLQPGGLEMSEKIPMLGSEEDRVTYPEFYRLANGDLLFFYREGSSGNGDLVINKYSIQSRHWIRLQRRLIDGEGHRNAYWQACIDRKGVIHISWVWRESPEVASNHDLCYARSKDGGLTWESAGGKPYTLPITAANAEHICSIPQRSDLINQTSMTADEDGHPIVATYWRDSGEVVPQYHVAWFDGQVWKVSNTGFRKLAFTLGGVGTQRIPLSRPQIVAWAGPSGLAAALIFRDDERGDRISAAVTHNLVAGAWIVHDLTDSSVGAWEPTYDTEKWKEKGLLDLYVQRVSQPADEGKPAITGSPVQVLEVDVKKL